jgi:preprotein translocase subunit SecG
MEIVVTVILTIQILTALAMIGLILVQHGKGADMGAAFGSGGSGSLFGASGSANFLSRTTAVCATIFFVSTLALAYFGNVRAPSSGSVLESTTAPAVAPATPAAPDASQIPAK